jgi:hypothetical protein
MLSHLFVAALIALWAFLMLKLHKRARQLHKLTLQREWISPALQHSPEPMARRANKIQP